MKFIYLSFIILVFSSGCFCPDNQIYPVPDRVKYSSINIDYIQRYVLRDTVGEKYDGANADTTLLKTIKQYYDPIFENERVESIDFLDSLKAKVEIYSKGKIAKTLHTNFNPYFEGIELVGTLDNDYITLFVNSPKTVSIPYIMRFNRKQGQSQQINNIQSTSFYTAYDSDDIIKSQIESGGLKINDTVYYNRVELIYTVY